MNAHSPPPKIDRAYALARLGCMCETLMAAKRDDRAALLQDYCREMGIYVRGRLLSIRECGPRLWDVAEKSGLVRDMGAQEAQKLFDKSIDEGVKGVLPSSPVQAFEDAGARRAATPPAVDPPAGSPVAQNAKEAGSTPASHVLSQHTQPNAQPASAASNIPSLSDEGEALEAAGRPSNVNVALEHAQSGIAVFACRPDKKPHVRWRDESTTDKAALCAMWAIYKDAIPAIDCGKSGLFVIDADRKHGAPDGVANFEGLCAANNDTLSGVPRVNTPGGGVHYIFSQPEGETLGNSPGALGGRGIDARGVGGYILAPGATLPDGRRYTYAEGSARLENGPPPPPPQWLLDVIRAGRPPKPTAGKHHNGNGQVLMPVSAPPHALTPEQIERASNIAQRSLEKIDNAPRGTSNDTINREAYVLGGVAARLPPDDAKKLYDRALEMALDRAAKGNNDPRGTRATFNSGWVSGVATPWAPDAGMPAEAVAMAKASVARITEQQAQAASNEARGAAHASSNGPWPDPKPIPSGLSPVRSLDLDCLPASIAPWVADIADRLQCPPDFVAIPAIVALGATLGRKIGIRPQRRTDWLEVPNMWGCIIGRPGALKSPAMQQVIRPLKNLEANARAANDEAEKNYKRSISLHKIQKEVAANKAREAIRKGQPLANLFEFDEPEQPLAKRYLTSDTSYEALGEILAANPNGVMAFRDELVSLLKTLDREEYAAARGFFLSAWNGNDSYTFDRIIRGRTHIEAACLSLLGSTQPGRIAEYMRRAIAGGAADDGLIQRFGLLVWPDQSPEWRDIDRYPDTPARHAAWRTFGSFDSIDPMHIGAQKEEFESVPFLRFGDAAQDIFAGWRSDLEKRLRGGELHPALESHFSKYRKLVPSLALVNHLADEGGGPVSETAIRRAIAFVEYLETHATRAYGAGIEAEAAAAKAISKRIKNGNLKDGFTARELWRNQWTGLTDLDTVKAGLELLADLHWLDATEIKTTGRPRVTYAINPKVGRR